MLVSFDTFANKRATDFALTLRSMHRDYHYSRLTRTILVGTDINYYSENALEWLFEELAEDGDVVVCLRAVDACKFYYSRLDFVR
jgi:hypothetical protein